MHQRSGSLAPWGVRAVTVALGVLGWLTAQHLTLGIIEHTHLGAAGRRVAHEHHYAGPIALTALVALGLGLAAVALGAWRRVPGRSGWPAGRICADPVPSRAGRRRHSTLAATSFVAVEIVEQLLAGNSAGMAQTAVLLSLGTGAQVALATMARLLSLRLLDLANAFAVALMPLHRRRAPVLGAPVPVGAAEGRGAQTTPGPARGRAPPRSVRSFAISLRAVARQPVTR